MMDIEQFNGWLKFEGAKIKRINDFVNEQFHDENLNMSQLKLELIDKAISPYHYFKENKKDSKPFKKGNNYG